MKPTDRKVDRKPRPGSRFLADVLADNVRALRTLRRLSQSDLAGRMKHFRHMWSHSTVSEIERAARNITADELLALAMSLEVPIGDLLDPTGIEGRRDEALDHGLPDTEPFPPRLARHVLRDEVGLYPLWEGTVRQSAWLVCDVDGQEKAREEAQEDLRTMAVREGARRQAPRRPKGKGKR